MNVRSPAPPVIALIGLLGILAGEQIVPIAKRLVSGGVLSLGWLQSECGEHIFGALPTRRPLGEKDKKEKDKKQA
jgi:xanthosine utilization system XapX-like protein